MTRSAYPLCSLNGLISGLVNVDFKYIVDNVFECD